MDILCYVMFKSYKYLMSKFDWPQKYNLYQGITVVSDRDEHLSC